MRKISPPVCVRVRIGRWLVGSDDAVWTWARVAGPGDQLGQLSPSTFRHFWVTYSPSPDASKRAAPATS